jgi:hypothetical protein
MRKAELFNPTFSDFSGPVSVGSVLNPPAFPGVYALFDKNDDCVYVGQSKCVPLRVRAHQKRSWYSKCTTLRTLALPGEEARLIRETVLVLSHSPSANRAIKLGRRADGTFFECQFLRFSKPKKRSK